MPMKFWFIAVINLIYLLPETRAQLNTHGTPFMTNHFSIEYQFHPKNFSIIQSNEGMMYFANAYGVLEYDGVSWRTINLPDGKSAMSFAKDSNGKIYIGSVGDIGYLDTDSIGTPFFKSLIHLTEETDRNFGEVWRTFAIGDKIFFCSHQQIIILEKEILTVLRPSDPNMIFDFFGEVNERFFCREAGRGLLEHRDGALALIKNGEQFSNSLVYFIQNTSNGLSIMSDAGSLSYDNYSLTHVSKAIDNFVREHGVTCGVSLKNNFAALGTVDNGILIFDGKGDPVQHLTKKNGLPGDYIYDIYVDKENNLWAATDNGISHIQISSPFTNIGEQAGVEGMGYAACVSDGKLYLGTSKGVFYKNWIPFQNFADASQGFMPVANAEGQVWFMAEVRGVLLCGHTQGLFQIKNGNATKISEGDYTGGWTYKTISNSPYLILGTYVGLEVYEMKNGSWQFRNKIKGFEESSRTIDIDRNSNVWVNHGNKGLFKLTLDADMHVAENVENISLSQGFAPDYFNDIATIEGDLIFAGSHHVYRYNHLLQKLERYDELNDIMSDNFIISKISQQSDGDIWMVDGDVIEILAKQNNGTFIQDKTPMSKLKGQLIGSYEYFWRYNASNYFIGTQNGFVHFEPTASPASTDFYTVIRKVESINIGESPIFDGIYVNIEDIAHSDIQNILYEQNALRFSYAALFYEDQSKTSFQYLLDREGDDASKWSELTNVTYKEYTNLWEGKYSFHVRARNIHGLISNVCTFQFRVLPPWYRTAFALSAYTILFILMILSIAKLVKQKIIRDRLRVEKEKAKEILLMEKQFAEESLRAEREIILLQNEKLESDVRYKNDELAHLATNLAQKSEFLVQLKKELTSITKDHAQESNDSLSEIIRTIDKGTEFDDGWDHFQTTFDTVHHNFLYKMRDRFPFLKSTDLLLCAYIRINKSNKEISSLLNISVSAVEKRRFRLREKLTLHDDTRLTEFLLQI
jgi:ligand-binding sensor domain-containing protein